jgi:hypothetical protein
VIVTDYRGLKEAEQLKTLEQLTQIANMSSTSVPFLNIFEGTRIGPEYMHRVQTLGKDCQPKTKRQTFGITDLKNIFIKAYIAISSAKEIRTFDNENEAMDWLVR